MANNVYRFDGDKRRGHITSSIRTQDANGIMRDVPVGGTIELTDDQVARLRHTVEMSLSTDPVTSSPVAKPINVVGTPAIGQTAIWNGTDWVPGDAGAGGIILTKAGDPPPVAGPNKLWIQLPADPS